MRSCRWGEGYAIALALQEKYRAPCNALLVLTVVVVTTEFAVHGAVGQDVIDDPQQGVRQGDDSLLRPFLGPR
jgi:hypothetical protein